jgi:competence protein ComEC
MGFDEAIAALGGRLGAALLAERERWILWLPVAVGAGVALYFALPSEPERWIGPAAMIVALAAAIAGRRRTVPVILAIGVGAAALGFTLACERTQSAAAPILARPAVAVDLTGTIRSIEPLETGQRLTLDRVEMPLRDGGSRPLRVRVRLPDRAAAALRPGARISIRATLLPPPMPAAPGAYDFQREAWFLRIGAVGYALGAARLIDAPAPEGWRERIAVAIAQARHALTQRIADTVSRAVHDPGAGPVAADLVTGERGAVPPDILQGYRDAGLAHILVIAGMHMSMVAGLVFVTVRGFLAAIPWVALRYPIKKWTALIALLVMAGYLVISGATVPTQRAFIMNAIVMIAILFDREAISLRTISWAALAVLALEPEALVGPSFQLSFAAVYALISAYEFLTPRLLAWRQADRLGWWTGPALYIGGIMLTTLVAGGATAFYTVYHFNRYSSYALLGNLLAVPVVGFWVMPAALLAMLLLPFGLDGWGWWLMGHGIAVVNDIALMTSHLPGAAVDLPAMPPLALVAFTLGGLWLCLWRQRWRRYGLIGMALGIALAALHRPPDLMIDGGGRLAALRGADGRLVFSPSRADRRARETWAQMAGQGDAAPIWTTADGVRCDALGCVWRAPSHLVALARLPEATIEDCGAADLVIVPVPMFAPCPSAILVLDGVKLHRGGTHAIWLDGVGAAPRVLSVADWQGRRPWSMHTSPARQRPPRPSGDDGGDNQADTNDKGDERSDDSEAPPDEPEP